MPVDKDSASRHYRGPEAAAVPPPAPMPSFAQAAMPPAEELGYVAEPFEPTRVEDEMRRDRPHPDVAYAEWRATMKVGRLQSDMEALLHAAFDAGMKWEREQALRGIRRTEQPLEGTVESRTLVAALTFFRDQVLDAGPEEIRTGEWLNVADVDRLIRSIQEDGRRRAAERQQA